MEVDSADDAAKWDVVPAGRGHDGLRALAGDGFSGGVTDGQVWAMLTNGRVVGVVGGDLDGLADADLTAHEAPDPALPLLLVMRERSGTPRANYYTEEMPLREVDERLREGGFTGFVELAENVLSGDYYLVYYGGERTPLAFVGGSRRLETGDEAFERAADEVGIYGVHTVDVSVTDVPGSEAPADGAGDTDPETDEPGVTAEAPDGSEADEPAETDGAETGAGDTNDDEIGSSSTGVTDTNGESDDDAAPGDRGAAIPDIAAAASDTDGADTDTAQPGDEDDGAPAAGVEPPNEAEGRVGGSAAAGGGTVVDGDANEEIPTAEADTDRLAELRDECEALRGRIEALTAEREELRETVEALTAEREELRDQLASGGETAGESLSPAAALSGTNLFVRYRSKADPTLDRALSDGGEREAVEENLLLERHTSFETEGATVGGKPYDEFLGSTLQYRFVEWLVRAFPFELRDAAGKRPLGRLYRAIPSFDRAEIDGTVAGRTENGESDRSFDVVVRDRKGAPLAVASLFDGRRPATEAMLSELVEDARAAAAANESLGAAAFVTTSYYEPEALEVAEAETNGGGLFGRGSRESYVRLDRSHGFHLCLVEARDGGFHLGVPEL